MNSTLREFLMTAEQVTWMVKQIRDGNAKHAFEELGKTHGFKPNTFEYTDRKCATHFLAEPINVVAAS